MEHRKIQVVGNRSYSISLPKKWVIANNLKEKDLLFLEEINNKILVKTSDNLEKNNSKISVRVNDIDDVGGFIIFCYVKSINNIKFIFKKFDTAKRREIISIIKFLEGYEITNENEKEIEISFLFKNINIDINTIIKRMKSLLIMMLDSIKEKDFKSTEEIEQNIDSLYHLSRRILFKCSKNSILSMENNIKNGEDIFFYLTIFRRIEKIADHIFKIRNENFSENDFKLLDNFLSEIDLLLSGKRKNFQKEIVLKSKNKLIQKKLVKIENVLEDMVHDVNFIKLNKKFFN